MATVMIEPLDDAAKKALIKAVADRGYAQGLKAAAMLLEKMATGRMRVVGTNDVKELASVLMEKSDELHKVASDQIAALEAASRK